MAEPIDALAGMLGTAIVNRLKSHFADVDEVRGASDADLMDIRSVGPVLVQRIRTACAILADRTRHMPHRGSDVEAWLKRKRDEYALTDGTPGDYEAWTAMNDALDDYRMHADTGTPLDVPTEEIGPTAAESGTRE